MPWVNRYPEIAQIFDLFIISMAFEFAFAVTQNSYKDFT